MAVGINPNDKKTKQFRAVDVVDIMDRLSRRQRKEGRKVFGMEWGLKSGDSVMLLDDGGAGWWWTVVADVSGGSFLACGED